MTNEVYPLCCPFCGAAPSDIAVTQDFQQVKVICLKCSAEFTLANHFRTERRAVVNAWNTRSVTAAAVMGYEAAQAERTCTNASYRLDESRFHCSECSFGCWVKDVADGRDKLPTYCPNCGAKVVEHD